MEKQAAIRRSAHRRDHRTIEGTQQHLSALKRYIEDMAGSPDADVPDPNAVLDSLKTVMTCVKRLEATIRRDRHNRRQALKDGVAESLEVVVHYAASEFRIDASPLVVAVRFATRTVKGQGLGYTEGPSDSWRHSQAATTVFLERIDNGLRFLDDLESRIFVLSAVADKEQLWNLQEAVIASGNNVMPLSTAARRPLKAGLLKAAEIVAKRGPIKQLALMAALGKGTRPSDVRKFTTTVSGPSAPLQKDWGMVRLPAGGYVFPDEAPIWTIIPKEVKQPENVTSNVTRTEPGQGAMTDDTIAR